MSQKVSIISGVDSSVYSDPPGTFYPAPGVKCVPIGDASAPSDDSHSSAWAVRALQKARANIVNLWERAWDLKQAAVWQAEDAVKSHDKSYYDHAKKNFDEASRWQARARDQISENDRLRSTILDQVKGKLELTQDALAWFTQPAGLGVPALYDARVGGKPIDRLPSFS